MSKIITLLLVSYSLLGYLAHLARRFTTDGMTGSWRELANYAMGVLCVLPLSTYMFDVLEGEIPSPTLRHMVASMFAFSSFGVGVVLGHRYDRRSQ